MDWYIVIHFADGRELKVNFDKIGSNYSNSVQSMEIDEGLFASGQSPLGVVSSNILNLELFSNDKSLFPDNNKSTYYGYMNDTAYIDVYKGVRELGRYFVDVWRVSISAGNRSKIVVQAYDEMSAIMKKSAPVIDMDGNLNNYIKGLLDNIPMKVSYKDTDIVCKRFSRMLPQCIDKSNMGTVFNTLSQSFLMYIFIDRSNNIRFLDMLDRIRGSSYTLSDCINVTSAKLGDGNLVKYDGIKLTYCSQSKTSPKIVSEVSQRVVNGINKLDSISFEGQCDRIVSCVIETSVGNVSIKGISYNKNNIDISIESDLECDINLKLLASMIENNKIVKQVGGERALEIENSLIVPSDVSEYVNSVSKIINAQSSTVSVTGYFDADEIELGDVVTLDLSATIGITGRYRVTNIKINVGATEKCEVTGVRYYE